MEEVGAEEELTQGADQFKREVAETFLRCIKEHISHENAVIELNGLKIAEDRTFADCARWGPLQSEVTAEHARETRMRCRVAADLSHHLGCRCKRIELLLKQLWWACPVLSNAGIWSGIWHGAGIKNQVISLSIWTQPLDNFMLCRYIFTTMLSLCLPPGSTVKAEYYTLFPEGQLDTKSKEGRLELLRRINAQLKSWKALMQRFLKSSDDQVRYLLGG